MKCFPESIHSSVLNTILAFVLDIKKRHPFCKTVLQIPLCGGGSLVAGQAVCWALGTALAAATQLLLLPWPSSGPGPVLMCLPETSMKAIFTYISDTRVVLHIEPQ